MRTFFGGWCGSNRKHLSIEAPYSKPKSKGVVSETAVQSPAVPPLLTTSKKYIELRPIPDNLKSGLPIPPPRPKHQEKTMILERAKRPDEQKDESKSSTQKAKFSFHKFAIKLNKPDKKQAAKKEAETSDKGKENVAPSANVGVSADALAGTAAVEMKPMKPTTTDEVKGVAKAAIPLTALKTRPPPKHAKSAATKQLTSVEIPVEHSTKDERKGRHGKSLQKQILSPFKKLNLGLFRTGKSSGTKKKRVAKQEDVSKSEVTLPGDSRKDKSASRGDSAGGVSFAHMEMHLQEAPVSSADMTSAKTIEWDADTKAELLNKSSYMMGDSGEITKLNSKIGKEPVVIIVPVAKEQLSAETKTTTMEQQRLTRTPIKKPQVLEVKAGTSSVAEGGAAIPTHLKLRENEQELHPMARTRRSKHGVVSSSFGQKQVESPLEEAQLDVQINVISCRKTFAAVVSPQSVQQVECHITRDGRLDTEGEVRHRLTELTIGSLGRPPREPRTSGIIREPVESQKETEHSRQSKEVEDKYKFQGISPTSCLNANDSRRITNILTTQNEDSNVDDSDINRPNCYQKIEIVVKNVGTSSYTVTLSKGGSLRSRLGEATKQYETGTVEITSSKSKQETSKDIEDNIREHFIRDSRKSDITAMETHILHLEPGQHKASGTQQNKLANLVVEENKSNKLENRFKRMSLGEGKKKVAQSTTISAEDGTFETRRLLFNGRPVVQDLKRTRGEQSQTTTTKPSIQAHDAVGKPFKPSRKSLTLATAEVGGENVKAEGRSSLQDIRKHTPGPGATEALSKTTFSTCMRPNAVNVTPISGNTVYVAAAELASRRAEAAENARIVLALTSSNLEDSIPRADAMTTASDKSQEPHSGELPAM